MTFTLCLNTSTIKPQPLLEKIRLAAGAGFAGIELWINEVYEYVGQGGEVRDIEHALEDHGLTVPCAIALRAWGEAVDEEYPVMLDEAKRRFEMAARLGSPYLVATPPRQPCDLDQITRRYRDLLDIGRRVGVVPLFEYISFFHSVKSLQQAWQVVQDAAHDAAALVLDSFHTWNANGTLDGVRPIPADRIGHWHIDDAARHKGPGEQVDADRVLPGDGVIDLQAEARLLREKGYQGAVSLELFNPELWEKDPRKVLSQGIERMREILQ